METSFKTNTLPALLTQLRHLGNLFIRSNICVDLWSMLYDLIMFVGHYLNVLLNYSYKDKLLSPYIFRN